MLKYIIRVGVSSDYASKLWDENINFAATMKEALGDYIVENICSNLIDYLAFVADDDSELAVREHITKIFLSLYPAGVSELNIMMVPDDGSEIADVMRTIYRVYINWDPYLKLCTDYVHVLPYATSKSMLNVLYNMNYIVSIDSGCGFSTMISSYADFLSKLKVFDESNESIYEYIVGEETSNGETSMDDIIDALWDEDKYNTVIGLDISYFLNKDKQDELRRMLSRIYKLQDKYVFMFRVPYLETKAFNDLCKLIEDVVSAKRLHMEPCGKIALLEYAYAYFNNCNIATDLAALNVFNDMILEEKKDGRFYNFKTANKLIETFAYHKFLHDAKKSADKDYFDPDSLSLTDLSAIYEAIPEDERSGFDELSELIGMEDIAERIREIVAQVTIAIQNNRIERPCLHMRFAGAPGTGKTTVARIVGKIFKENKILRKGSFFEYSARSLCGEYIGQTAPKTLAACKEAYGSVLFIDEAYSLYEGQDGKDYGKEALTTLIAEMENHRDDMVVIMAGYTDDMAKLMEGNAGLRSRMPYLIEFKSYTREQLSMIFMKLVKKHFEYDAALEKDVKEYFNKLSDSYINSKEFANARFVRNLYERTWAKAALRASAAGQQTITILPVDFELASGEKEFSEKIMLDKKIGF